MNAWVVYTTTAMLIGVYSTERKAIAAAEPQQRNGMVVNITEVTVNEDYFDGPQDAA